MTCVFIQMLWAEVFQEVLYGKHKTLFVYELAILSKNFKTRLD